MQPADRQILQIKKQHLQLKLNVKQWLNEFVEDALEVLEEFRSKNLHYQITGLKLHEPPLQTEIQNQLSDAPYADWQLNRTPFNPPDSLLQIEKIFRKFPSQTAFHYLPDLPEFTPEQPANALQEMIARFNLVNEELTLHYLRYAPLIQILLHDFAKANPEETTNPWHGDLLILPKSEAWLIVFNLEEKWFFTRLEE